MDNINGVTDISWINAVWAAIIFMIILMGAYYVTRYVGKRALNISKGKYIEIIDKAMLTNDKWLCIAKVGPKYYLLSVTSASIKLIAEIQLQDLQPVDERDSTLPFSKYMKILIKKMGRKTDDNA